MVYISYSIQDNHLHIGLHTAWNNLNARCNHLTEYIKTRKKTVESNFDGLSGTGWAEPSFLSSLLHIPNAPYMEHLKIHIYRILKPNARKYSIWALGYETMH